MNAPDTIQLAKLVDLKVSLLERVLMLGQKQLELIENQDYGELLKMLGLKQRLLGGLQNVEQGLMPFRNQDASQRIWQSPEDRASCERNLQRCEELLRIVLAQEEQSELRMATRRDDTARQLQDLHSAAEVQGAYGYENPQEFSSTALDLLSEG
jgi:hypothetical protein